MKKLLSRRGLALTLAAISATACESPEGILATRPIEAILSGAVVGTTASGEGRARLATTVDVYLGVAGTRAYLSTDDGATYTSRQPLRRVSNEPAHLMLTDLTPGTTYTVQVVSVTNLGVESAPNLEGPLAVVVPATKDDDEVPTAPDMNRVENHGDALSVRWYQAVDADVFGYWVERAVDGGAFEVVSDLLQDSIAPHFRDTTATTPGAYEYRVVTEDLSGNLSAPSLTLTINVL